MKPGRVREIIAEYRGRCNVVGEYLAIKEVAIKLSQLESESAPPPGDGGLERKIEALAPYLRHTAECEVLSKADPSDEDCDCGLEYALTALGRPAETQGAPCPLCDGQGHNYFVLTGETFECTLCHGQGIYVTAPSAPTQTQLTPSEGGDTTGTTPAPRPGNAPVEGTTSASSTEAISNASGQPAPSETMK